MHGKKRYPAIQLNKQYSGVFYEHSADKNLQFNTYDVKTISTLIKNEEIHVPNECTVVAITPLNCSYKIQVLIACPSCSKSNIEVVYKDLEA